MATVAKVEAEMVREAVERVVAKAAVVMEVGATVEVVMAEGMVVAQEGERVAEEGMEGVEAVAHTEQSRLRRADCDLCRPVVMS